MDMYMHVDTNNAVSGTDVRRVLVQHTILDIGIIFVKLFQLSLRRLDEGLF